MKAHMKVPRMRLRHRVATSSVPGLSLALPRMSQRHKLAETWVPGLSLVLSRLRQRPGSLLSLAQSRRRLGAIARGLRSLHGPLLML
ncbi:hypothetical protein BHE74_00001435 [Ensete ventricosum]|nr:hypothetical protein BHE74_00001435 [Ensete ventricosum]